MNSNEHNLKVKKIQRQVKDAANQGLRIKIRHGGTNSTRRTSTDGYKNIDTSGLNEVICVDGKNKVAWVEPNVSLDTLVSVSGKQGLVPLVVSEFPKITVAGAVQGGAGESSSFRYGTIDQICDEYEVVTGDGKLVKASPKKNSDLFYGSAGSYGSFGVITLIKIRLQELKPYVKLTYKKVSSYEQALSTIRESVKTNVEFIDGILFSPTEGVIMLGEYSDKINLRVRNFHKSTDEWFYLHVQKLINQHDNYTELIPYKDYLFRYDRGAFWMGGHGFKVMGAPFNKLSRLLFAPAMTTSNLYRFLHGSGLAQHFLVQDLCTRRQNTVGLLRFIEKNFDIFPVWLCPLKPSPAPYSPTHLNTDLVIDVGTWGILSPDYEIVVRGNRKVESEMAKIKGRKTLYAHSYYSEEDFWKIYDRPGYEKLRKKYHADKVFRDIYEKVNVKEKYTVSKLRGWRALFKSPY